MSYARRLVHRAFGGDRWIPWMFVLGFAVVFAANGALIVSSLGTFSGLDTQHPYEDGLAQNRTIAKAAREAKEGWAGSVRLVGDRLVFQLRDAGGAPVAGAEVQALLARPVEVGHDFRTIFRDGGAAGRYVADPRFPLAGQWEVRVLARRGAERYHLIERVVVPGPAG